MDERTKAVSEQLERLVDAEGLADVLSLLAEICEEKSAHVQENWQDEALARLWAGAGFEIQRLADRVGLVAGGRS